LKTEPPFTSQSVHETKQFKTKETKQDPLIDRTSQSLRPRYDHGLTSRHSRDYQTALAALRYSRNRTRDLFSFSSPRHVPIRNSRGPGCHTIQFGEERYESLKIRFNPVRSDLNRLVARLLDPTASKSEAHVQIESWFANRLFARLLGRDFDRFSKKSNGKSRFWLVYRRFRPVFYFPLPNFKILIWIGFQTIFMKFTVFVLSVGPILGPQDISILAFHHFVILQQEGAAIHKIW
jgi:hypothetical protein